VSVLFVCTANIGRSAVAELLARHYIVKAGFTDIPITSAGTRALVGAPVDPPMERLLRADGIDPSEFCATQLTRELVDGAGVVLTATTDHRARTAAIAPRAVRKVFTMIEFARLLDKISRQRLLAEGPVSGPERIAWLAEAAAYARSRSTGRVKDESIPDAYRRRAGIYRRVYTQTKDTVAGLSQVFVGRAT
jgi:protein-tyrosine phosphatase